LIGKRGGLHNVALYEPGSFKYVVVRSGLSEAQARAFVAQHGALVPAPLQLRATLDIITMLMVSALEQVSRIPKQYFSKV